ncbi:MAG: hypothetical protein SCH98_05590 [Deferrisomatales bacterium]|nr:hypothetical protein [Deferrisomatales bacterium]
MNVATRRLPLSLLFLRLSVFLVMLMWTIDKFVRPGHAASVFQDFYGLERLGSAVMYAVGAAELLLILGFVAGLKKRLTYGTVLLLHAVSTLSSFRQYLSPFEGGSLLFFAAWPMLAACYALYALREEDTLWTVRG